jgi:hypothetical protein
LTPPRRGPGLAVPLRRGYLVVGLATWVVAVTGCPSRPKPGAACRVPNALVCASSVEADVCTSGAWRAVPCRGPAGCSPGAGASRADRCDDTIAESGDACPDVPAIDYACTGSRADALACTNGHFDLWRHCRGERGCAIDASHHLDCDTTLGAVGDPCEKQGAYACSVERDAMLQCRGSSLATVSSCRGPEACHFDREQHLVACDDGVAREGDPCDTPGRVACAASGQYELACGSDADGGSVGPLTYAKKRECRRTDCRVDGTKLFCD